MQRWIVCHALVLAAVGLTLPGCKTAEPDYGRQLEPGEPALRKVARPQWPDLVAAARSLDPSMGRAMQRSAEWFKKPSTKKFFPIEGFSHQHAEASLYALRTIVNEPTIADFVAAFEDNFEVYASVGWDKQGTVLFTGYFSPVFRASRTRTAQYQYPIYQRPADLVTDPLTGEVIGRDVAGNIVPYPDRAEIESSGMLQGLELAWFASRLDAYIVEVNGSAKLNMTDGSTMYVGYAGTNGKDYTSIGRLLVQRDVMAAHEVSLPSLRDYFQDHPEELNSYIRENDRFVFFAEYNGGNWPAGSLGFKATPLRTLATDKDIFPRGGPMIVDVPLATGYGGAEPTTRFMMDQDTGGAIRAPGRADFYFGIGDAAEQRAGNQKHEGKMFYLFLKPERVSEWVAKMREDM